jgi:hypothetical protein
MPSREATSLVVPSSSDLVLFLLAVNLLLTILDGNYHRCVKALMSHDGGKYYLMDRIVGWAKRR